MSGFLDRAKKMISIKSVTSDGNEEIANYAASLMSAAGMKVQLQQVAHSLESFSKRQFNVIGILGDPLVDRKTKKGLLLNTHLDTVGPGLNENWTETGGNAFSATLKEGKIFGLGSADVKLDFLCKLLAVEKFRERKLKMPIYLVGTCGEEVGMFGAKYLIKSMALNPKYVLVGEPSELRVVYAHKCYNIFRVSIGYSRHTRDAKGFNRKVVLEALGKSAHGSYPEMGVNGILRLLEFIKGAQDSGFDLRMVSMSGGDSVNKVPDRAKAELFLTSHQLEDFKGYFSQFQESLGGTSALRADMGGVGDSGVQFYPDALFPAICDVIAVFGGLAEELSQAKDETYNPPYSTVNFGRVVDRPGAIDLMFDLRLLPEIAPQEVESRLQDATRKLAAHYPGLNISVLRERMNPSLNMSWDHSLMNICRSAIEETGIHPAGEGFDKKATSTEAAQYFQAGYEAVVFGPGRSHGNSHSPNEYNTIDQLEKAVLFYEKVIEKTCL
ncbi:MAG: M20/M25/M40 family metallo-hydrolase [Bdellovibrionales bacterium]|nr:M20/M25/M40 family metallo-hydrolase [Bdellovibrionales bacterium]